MAKRQRNFRLSDEDIERLELIGTTYGWPVSVVLRTAIKLLFEKTGITKETDMPFSKG